jgi:hypothetical protein
MKQKVGKSFKHSHDESDVWNSSSLPPKHFLSHHIHLVNIFNVQKRRLRCPRTLSAKDYSISSLCVTSCHSIVLVTLIAAAFYYFQHTACPTANIKSRPCINAYALHARIHHTKAPNNPSVSVFHKIFGVIKRRPLRPISVVLPGSQH